MAIQNRYDFVLLFDVKDGNPNGDPDAGNLPRLDPETGKGLVTDVCVKRKVRNYVAIKHQYQERYDIYVKEKAVLGRAHTTAFQELGIKLGQDMNISVPDSIAKEIAEAELPEGLSYDTDDEDKPILLISGVLDKKEVKKAIKESDLSKNTQTFLNKALTDAKSRKPTGEETERGKDRMCERFYDIRTFGAVMSLKSAPNCGQVRGPVQLTFARSVDPIVALEHSITRMAVATEAEAEKQGGDNRTMGRKHTVPYGLYVAHGFISSHLANQTGFSEEDLSLLWESLANMFEHDRSAARGEMTTRGLYVFKHDSSLGNAHAHRLFNCVTVQRKDNERVPREFADYSVLVNGNEMAVGAQLSPAQGVTLTRMDNR
ncbi:MAG: type I-C CRISPR-associated protein Cas7/Csd2 [Nitrosospira sp.]|nr:type I-C CRISPR-associated protein Cas7/Csd2 [Nitrosospira sp.]